MAPGRKIELNMKTVWRVLSPGLPGRGGREEGVR